jgi:ubiquinone/menaquinone biosynthesis C-methylase UbiE
VRTRDASLSFAAALAAVVLGALLASAPAGADEPRDAEIQPERVMDLIGIRPGMVVGEAGAGRGYFTLKLARRVGPTGRVYANDIDGIALEELLKRCREEKLGNVETVLGDVDPRFRPASLELAIMVYALHDFADPRGFLEKLKPSLRSGATVVILDRDPEATGERHFLPRERLLEIFRESGYALELDERSVRNHVLLVFRVAA